MGNPFTDAFLTVMDAEQDQMAAGRKLQDAERSADFKRGEHTGRERGLIVAGYHMACKDLARALAAGLKASGAS